MRTPKEKKLETAAVFFLSGIHVVLAASESLQPRIMFYTQIRFNSTKIQLLTLQHVRLQPQAQAPEKDPTLTVNSFDESREDLNAIEIGWADEINIKKSKHSIWRSWNGRVEMIECNLHIWKEHTKKQISFTQVEQSNKWVRLLLGYVCIF